MVLLHRKAARLSIRELAERAMVSKSSIVALEHGKSCRPSTLAKVCAAMNLHLDRFTASSLPQSPAQRLHRRADEQWVPLDDLFSTPDTKGAKAQLLMFKNVPAQAGFIAGMIELSEKTEMRSHPGREFLYVTRGRAIVTVGDRDFVLETGEAITLLEFEPHAYGPAPGEDEPVAFLCFRVG